MPKALVPLLAITFVDVLGFTILIPILPFYAESFGATPRTIGAIYATVGFCSLIASPLWGRLSDRIGRKGVLLAAQIAGLLGFSLLAVGTTLWTVFVARAIEGLGGGGLGVTQAYVSDVTTPEQRARAFGLIGATFGLGFLIGPALAGVLIPFGYRVPFVVAAALALLTCILTLTMLPESHGRVDAAPSLAAIRRSLGSPRLGRLLLTQFLFSITFTAWVSVFALFAEHALHLDARGVTIAFIVSALVGIVVQAALIGRIVDRFGEGRTAAAGLVCALVAYASVPLVTVPALLYAFIALWALSGALIRPALGALISQAAPADQRGTILSINDSLSNVAFVLAPLASTTVLAYDPRLSGVVPMVFAILAIAVGAPLLFRRDPPLAALG